MASFFFCVSGVTDHQTCEALQYLQIQRLTNQILRHEIYLLGLFSKPKCLEDIMFWPLLGHWSPRPIFHMSKSVLPYIHHPNPSTPCPRHDARRSTVAIPVELLGNYAHNRNTVRSDIELVALLTIGTAMVKISGHKHE